MLYKALFLAGSAASVAAYAAPTDATAPVVDFKNETEVEETYLALLQHLPEAARREMFPRYAVKGCHKRGAGCSARERAVARMAMGEESSVSVGAKNPVKTLEMLALNDDLSTVVSSPDFCTRRHAMARAAGLAAGLALSAVSAPGFAAGSAAVKMGSDSGQLVFVPDEVKICAGDTVTWTNNKGGPHNVVFDEEAIPSGVAVDSISMDDQLGEEGQTFSKKFDTKGTYAYFCEPHRGAGMNAQLIVG